MPVDVAPAPATPPPQPHAPPAGRPEPVAPAPQDGQAANPARTVVTPQPEDRLLEESSTLLADFFNGQVIVMEAEEDTGMGDTNA